MIQGGSPSPRPFLVQRSERSLLCVDSFTVREGDGWGREEEDQEALLGISIMMDELHSQGNTCCGSSSTFASGGSTQNGTVESL